MNEPFDSIGMFQYGVGNRLRTKDIGNEKDSIEIQRPGHMCFSGKMHDDLRPFNKVIDKVEVVKVAVPEFESARVANFGWNILNVSGVGQRIKNNDLIIGILMKYVR